MSIEYKPFALVSVLGRKPGLAVGIASVYDAAVFMLVQWPDEAGPKARDARAILLKCLEGSCSAAIARVAFVEAAREANIYVAPEPKSLVAGRSTPKWRKKRMPWRRGDR